MFLPKANAFTSLWFLKCVMLFHVCLHARALLCEELLSSTTYLIDSYLSLKTAKMSDPLGNLSWFLGKIGTLHPSGSNSIPCILLSQNSSQKHFKCFLYGSVFPPECGTPELYYIYVLCTYIYTHIYILCICTYKIYVHIMYMYIYVLYLSWYLQGLEQSWFPAN